MKKSSKTRIVSFLLLNMLVCFCVAQEPLIYLNEKHLLAVKEKISASDPYFSSAYKSLLASAEQELLKEADPVTNKTLTPPSGDKHDYMSLAPYRWPDPSKPKGLPWLVKDGIINPQARGPDTDHVRVHLFFDSMKILSLAYFFSGDTRFSDKAKSLLQIWLLDKKTKMNPNLNFAQAAMGISEGRDAGIIDWKMMSDVLIATRILQNGGQLKPEFKQAIDQWFSDYLHWLRTSENGKSANLLSQNHATWYDYQVVGLMLYLGKKADAIAKLEEVKLKRIATQIEPDGKMPGELGRTKSASYSSMNVFAFVNLANFGKQAGVDLWGYSTKDGRSIKNALAFLKPYVLREKEWEWVQITPGGVSAALDTSMKPMFSQVSTMMGEKLLPDSAKASESLNDIQRLTYPPLEKI